MNPIDQKMKEVIANSDVVIVNPTRYAVALKYEESKKGAPIVVAKGMDHIALQIKKIARESGVHIVQNPSLARELYTKVDIDKEIPTEFFTAVGEVLAYVYKINKSKEY